MPTSIGPLRWPLFTDAYTNTHRLAGVLVECDASIKSIIVNIDNEYNNEFVIEVLDDQHLVVKETMVQALKQRLDDRLKNTMGKEEDIVSE